MISEGANIDLPAETCLLGFGFQGMDLITNALIGSAVCPFGLGWQWFAKIWPTAELEAEFCGGKAFALVVSCFCDRYCA